METPRCDCRVQIKGREGDVSRTRIWGGLSVAGDMVSEKGT
jgi:hypothetical protein